MNGELDGHGDRVKEPAKDYFRSVPRAVSLAEFLEGHWLSSERGVVAVERSEDVVDGVEEDPSHMSLMLFWALTQAEKIVDKLVDVCGGSRR